MKTKISLEVLKVLSIVFFVCFTIPELASQNNDSLKLAKESLHFDFYSTDADIKVLDSLATRLEKYYAGITHHLGIQINKKIKVKVFPNLKSFHAAINFPDAPDWVVGTGYVDELMIVSPLNPGRYHTYESLMQVIVHEFTHVAVYHVRADKGMSGIPKWLSEGYACYEAGQINDQIRKSIVFLLSEKELPTWAQLENTTETTFGQMNGYGISTTIVEFLIATYGFDKLVLLIKEPENIETIYGLSKDTLEKQWIRYLKHEPIK